MTGMILDIVIAVLLFITVAYCFRLSRKITLIHKGREELNQFIEDFNNAITRAEDNIEQLKYLGTETNDELQDHIQKARYLANDLSFLMDKGEKISTSLEHNIAISRTVMAYPPSNLPNTGRKNIEKSSSKTRRKATLPNVEELIKKSNPELVVSKDVTSEPVISSPMTQGKQQALDEVLAKIAVKQNTSTPNNKEKKSGKKNKRTVVGQKEVLFDKDRLSQTLKAAQSAE